MSEVKKVGRKAGVRSKKYEQALQDYFMGRGSISELARQYNINRSTFSRTIQATEKDTNLDLSNKTLKEAIAETKGAIFQGLENIKALQKSNNPLHQALAENIEQEIKDYSYQNFKWINTIGRSLLVDLNKENQELRNKGKMDLNNINKSLQALETANRVIGISNRTPLVAIQNNIQNNTQTNNNKESDLKININVIQPPKKKKESDIIEVISDE